MFSCDHFEELPTLLFEVELIINNGPLTCVYPSTMEICLTPNHLLFGRHLLYSSNIASTVLRNLTILSSTTDKINPISDHFWDSQESNHCWDRLRREDVSNSLKINVNNIVLGYDEKVPRHFWRIVIVTDVLPSEDSEITGAIVRIEKTHTILKRLVNKLFTVQNAYHDTNQTHKART